MFTLGGKTMSDGRTMSELPKVNRVEVIEDTGRSYVRWEDGIKVEVSMQDNDRTIKIFITKPKDKELLSEKGYDKKN